jgi:phosphoglycerate kinase
MQNNLKTMSDLEIGEGSRVLLRLDLNVPTDENGKIIDDFRIKESLPTIKLLQDMGTKIIIIAHKEEGSLEYIAEYLAEKISNFSFTKNSLENMHPIEGNILNPGEVLLLENIRLDKREKSKNVEERDELAKTFLPYIDCYINEAFSASHRNHASITSMPKFFPSCLGPNFIREIDELQNGIEGEHPILLILGGAKFETKLGLLEKFVDIADNIFVGGALAHVFWKLKGQEIGTSLFDEEVKLSDKVLNSDKIILPVDILNQDHKNKELKAIMNIDKITDFGTETLAKIEEMVNNSKTIIWNGPLGFYEQGFDLGTIELLKFLGNLEGKITILGGGDTVAVVQKVMKVDSSLHFTHVSSGGGAMIDFLSNGTLPGIDAIK